MKGKIKCLVALFALSLAFMITGVKAEASIRQDSCGQDSVKIS